MRIAMTLGVAVMLGSVSPVGAQELATSFDQLRVLVRAGDTLTVTDSNGREFRGAIASLSSTSLNIIVGGESRALGESEVSTIRLKRADSLANGAKNGFGVGAAIGLLAGLSLRQEFNSAGVIPFITLVYGALGTGVGVGVDALIQSDSVIFARQGGRTVTLKAAPILGPHTRGVRLALGF